MLDLKAKLASAGLVSENDIERVEKETAKKKAKRGKRGPKGKQAGSTRTAEDDIERVVAALQGKPKGEAYDTVRKWVERVRLDPSGNIPSPSAKTFHFAEFSGKVGRLYLEPEIVEEIQKGQAGVIAFMSHHGLAHAVVPAADARGIGRVFELWLRVLEGDPNAGKIDKPP